MIRNFLQIRNNTIIQRYRTGYAQQHALLNDLFGRFLALLILTLLLPLFVVIPVLIKLQDGGPVFFLSRRLGKDREPFNMFKFRSLVVGAEQKTGAQMLTRHHQLELPCGKFLRDTRLDEIPQLLNVIIGDMTFFGPRPERPAVYEEQCQNIAGYETRFTVKPGLLGFSQLFTPHGTPKRLRALVDAIYIRRPHQMSMELAIVVISMWRLGLYSLRRLTDIIWGRLTIMGGTGKLIEKRSLERHAPKGIKVYVHEEAGPQPAISRRIEVPDGFRAQDTVDAADNWQSVRFGDINDDFMLCFTESEPTGNWMRVVLDIRLEKRFGRNNKHKRIKCVGEITRSRQVEGTKQYANLVKLTPATPLNGYILDKYVLAKSIF